MTKTITTKYYCPFCGFVATGSGHYYCLGEIHLASIRDRLEEMRLDFERGDRKAAKQTLTFMIIEANCWLDEMKL